MGKSTINGPCSIAFCMFTRPGMSRPHGQGLAMRVVLLGILAPGGFPRLGETAGESHGKSMGGPRE